MPTRNARPTIFRWKTLTDAVDTTNGPQGGAQLLQNLVPAPYNRDMMVPRAAALQLTAFTSFAQPADVELQYVVGTRLYGFVASGHFPGRSEPFIYDYVANAFVPITGVTAVNTPASAPTTGNWTPPTAAQVGSRVMMTHPGYTGAAGIVMGWFDETGFTSTTVTGNTNSTTAVTGLSTNVLAAGWSVGMTIADSAGDIPPGTVINAIASGGLSLTMSQAATGSHTGATFTVAGGSFAAPLWTAGNMNQNPLPAVPVAVENFNGRAYYAVGDTLQFSDAGNAVQDSNNPNVQVINYQNALNITAIESTPFQNVLGGITQSLLVFQGAGAIQQVQGDPTTSNLSSQLLASGTGTLAPNSTAFVPNVGTAFISPDGLRFVNLVGTITPALGTNGDGVALPFINASFPSRIAGAWNDDTYRVCVETATLPGMVWGQSIWGTANWGSGSIVTVEYWYHTKLQTWTGPHSFPTTLLSANQTGGGFIISSQSVGAALYSSNAVPTSSDSYSEQGAPLQCNAETSLLPDNQMMAMNSLGAQSTTIGLASALGMNVKVSFARENGQILDSVQFPVNGGTSSIWGQFNWGQAFWGVQGTSVVWDGFNWGGADWGAASTVARYTQYAVYWNQALVFKQGAVGITFQAGPGTLLGNVYMRIEPLGYVLLGAADAA